jgi:cyclophilin family peptidyl-prolyl cis-trans isomerase/HEAT repeat protein
MRAFKQILGLLMIVVPGLARAASQESVAARAELLALADARRFEIATLGSLAKHSDSQLRAQTARTLGELANPAAALLLRGLARDRDASVRAAAAQGCGRLVSFLPPKAAARAQLGRQLQRLLDDRDAGVRAAAAWGVGMAAVPGGELWLLHRLTREREVSVCVPILQELWRFPGGLWVKRAMSYVTHPSPAVRAAAVWSLARSERADRLPALVRASTDKEPSVRLLALSGARRGASGGLWNVVLKALDDPDTGVRAAAFDALASVIEREASRVLPETVKARLALAIEGSDPREVHERISAIRLAGVARCCHEGLNRTFSGAEPWVAGEALVALARQGASGVEELAKEQATSAEASRRLAAVRAARWLPALRELVAAALADGSPAVRLAAIEALQRVEEPHKDVAVTALRGALADADTAVRAAAVEALGEIGAAPALEELLSLLERERSVDSADAGVALVAAVAKQKPLGAASRAALERLVRSGQPVLARAAWDVLVKAGSSAALPEVRTGESAEFYRQVVEWASSPRHLELVTVRGTMQIALETTVAPLTSYRLSKLAEKKFFDGLTFHRVVANFVVQGGDPRGDGWGGPDFVLRDELALTPYEPGAVGMALSGPDTGGSQLFITLTSQPHLIGRYCLFGRVTSGRDVADRIRIGDTILRVKAGEGKLGAFYPVWYGAIDPARLDAEITGWRAEREKTKPKKELLERLATASLRYDLVVVLGTWCGDSREQIPRLQAVLEALGKRSPFSEPRLLGVDRTKWINPSSYAFGPVEKVPTIVVLAGSSEVGRIVETPSSESIEEDLVRILAPIEGWSVPE